ncbi:MAG: Ribonuclease P protein component [Microgenomates group bacterium GW2011_GWC1_39_7b]|uniref:Ribonuclease P protein component n=3 Tax=Candidatus Woeseibacteriota TaxID=1752722 RepID=A0A0G0PS54_9BACT|nr:MAG: Ribonuclease P protein component [Candidatus Woesebacteria bacterium GW2011_GWB1_39_10]KKR26783.1 MAG: Ribonuclease P protein component [Microgenomates group bacterium GW2011_GWC1_39_7b]KKR72636.1 MAG: Ribonuclease P protein component [Candidatus Woesebacteria bacterium GW2011_GWA2_40_7]KKS91131.1 MAG: Ribonuclease P protein component [Candidatus Woesebacteria bacterium GW2011_GWA1_43_12]
MLSKKFRLTGSKNFKKVQDEGSIFQSVSFGIAYIDRKDINPSRFAFVVSTKISKDAVDRNRFKRTMSEAVRTSTIDVRNGFDVVFLAKSLITRTPASDLMKEVKASLKQVGISG